MVEIQKADPRTRRNLLLVAGIMGLLGAAALAAAKGVGPGLEAWIRADVSDRLQVVLAVLMLLTTAPAVGIGIYLWWLGARVARAERYPPPGARVVRDTPVVTGPTALRMAYVARVSGLSVALAGVLLAVFLWHLMGLVGEGSP